MHSESEAESVALGAQMSVVLVTDRYETIREVVARLRAQSVRDRLELVIVVPAGGWQPPEASELEGFAGVRVVEVDAISPIASARAAGVRAATAPVVQIGETHALPEPGWAEALIRAHAEPWGAVVPGVRNANPETALSWAALLVDYGRWLYLLPEGPIDHMPPYNTTFKRSLLLDFDGRLDSALGNGEELIAGFRARGHRLFRFEPAATIQHVNMARFSTWLKQRYLVGLWRAAERRKGWGRPRRILYVIGAPLIPAVVLWRVRSALRLMHRDGRLPTFTLPLVLASATIATFGEMVGYARGASPSVSRQLDDYEVRKMQFARNNGAAA